MATKTVKVKAHKRLDGTGKIESVDAHLREIEAAQKIIANQESIRGEIYNRFPAIRKSAIDSFITQNKLNPERLLSSIKSKKIVSGDLLTAIVGTPNNRYFKKVVDLSK